LRGTGTHGRHARLRATAIGTAALAVAALLGACGESSSDSSERAGNYPVKVTEASFPAEQHVGQTSLLKLAVRNTGKHAVPALTVTINLKGKGGAGSAIPFSVHDPQTGLANADRPVWVLAASYPRLEGSADPGGATTSSSKTYGFGPLAPGKTVAAVWKLSAVKEGSYTLVYGIDAGNGGEAKAVNQSGDPVGGTIVADVSTDLPETEVNGAGEIVEITEGAKAGTKKKGPAG
jgi:hypothetical protein